MQVRYSATQNAPTIFWRSYWPPNDFRFILRLKLWSYLSHATKPKFFELIFLLCWDIARTNFWSRGQDLSTDSTPKTAACSTVIQQLQWWLTTDWQSDIAVCVLLCASVVSLTVGRSSERIVITTTLPVCQQQLNLLRAYIHVWVRNV